jgi:hypothetical protein
MADNISLALANFVAVNPPAFAIWSISDLGLEMLEKS